MFDEGIPELTLRWDFIDDHNRSISGNLTKVETLVSTGGRVAQQQQMAAEEKAKKRKQRPTNDREEEGHVWRMHG